MPRPVTWRLRAALAAAALLAAVLAAPAGAASRPSCLTPAAPDEPLCNPFAASDWAIPHRNAYEQDSTPYAGPRRARDVRRQHVKLALGSLPFIQFSAPYADGRQVAWYSEVSIPDFERVGKVDVDTGRVIDVYQRPLPGSASPSGAYNVLDHRGRFIVAKGETISVYADARPGHRRSPIRKLQALQLPPKALCGAGDRLVGIVLTWQGDIAFATENGMVGVVPDRPRRLDARHVTAVSINPRATCTAPGGPPERVSNSIAADEHGGIYTVTSAAQYKHVYRHGRLRQAWRAPYESDGQARGIRLGAGSGSSPTLMGTSRRDDKLVAITDGRRVMHLLLLWRDRIPSDWKALAPGVDRRVACDVRIDFGDPGIADAQSEQSVAVRGTTAFVVNNALKDTSRFDSLEGSARYQAATLASGDPAIAAHGAEAVDWHPRTRTCSVRWANRRVSLPNGIPTIAAGSRMVYDIGQRDGVWGLHGLDLRTGRLTLWIPTGSADSHNSFYAGSEVLPDGSVWTGTLGGIDIFRPRHPTPEKARPALVCRQPQLTGCRPR